MTLRPISTATSLIALAVALKLSLAVQPAVAQSTPANVKVNPERDAYYGDLHLHTTYSFDAYVLFGAKVDPDMAYRFAKGEPVEYLGQMVQRREPLDFLAVTAIPRISASSTRRCRPTAPTPISISSRASRNSSPAS